MPTLFDSHEEFNEWFSRDIENHAENKSAIDQGISISKRCFFLYHNKEYCTITNKFLTGGGVTEVHCIIVTDRAKVFYWD